MSKSSCPCGSGQIKYALYDAQRIFLAYACTRCEAKQKARFRPEMFSGYDQNDVDESIDE